MRFLDSFGERNCVGRERQRPKKHDHQRLGFENEDERNRFTLVPRTNSDPLISPETSRRDVDEVDSDLLLV